MRNKAKNRVDILTISGDYSSYFRDSLLFRKETLQLKCTWAKIHTMQECGFSGTIKPDPDLLEAGTKFMKNTKNPYHRTTTVRNGYKMI